VASGGLRERILEVLERAGRPLEFAEIVEALGWEGPREELRLALAGLVREGLVERVPDYERRRMVFRLRGRG